VSDVVLAELSVRHTRRHMPTRRVALGDSYLPTAGAAWGAVLLGAVVAEYLPRMDGEQQDVVPALLREARAGLSVPRIAARYRLQTDVHGLDRSRHRVLDGTGGRVLELDDHGRPDPQVLGAVLAPASLPGSARETAFRALDTARRRPGACPEGLVVRRLHLGVPGGPPRLVGATSRDPWSGIPSERRWAMEVLGLRAEATIQAVDIQRRFRRLVRDAHPDHGGAAVGAAERLAELRDARALLLSSGAGSVNGR
jgi:hypothetical protein